MVTRGRGLFRARMDTRCIATVLWNWGAGTSKQGTGRAPRGKALAPIISQQRTLELHVLRYLEWKCLYPIQNPR